MAILPNMGGTGYTINNSSLYSTPSSMQITTGSGTTIKIDDCFIQYLDLISSLLGIEIGYEEFSDMDMKDRESFVKSIKRQIKLKNLDI